MYKVEEIKTEEYKQINEIKIRDAIGENGTVEKIDLLEENEAVEELQVENGKLKIIIQNEKEEIPDPTPEPEYTYYWDVYKIDKNTQLPMENVKFKITEIDEETGEEKDNSGIFTTDENGNISVEISNIKAGTYVYKIEETKVAEYKAINEIKI